MYFGRRLVVAELVSTEFLTNIYRNGRIIQPYRKAGKKNKYAKGSISGYLKRLQRRTGHWKG